MSLRSSPRQVVGASRWLSMGGMRSAPFPPIRVERELESKSPDESVPARFIPAVDRDSCLCATHLQAMRGGSPMARTHRSFGQTGYVVLFDIRDGQVLLAARALREEDWRWNARLPGAPPRGSSGVFDRTRQPPSARKAPVSITKTHPG